ncbi:MAG: hypothetical protein P4L31_04480, partial [Candidatus Babeliales bacterium]|nr:hypothetical protein [Candidatus Babeliales bacterium]
MNYIIYALIILLLPANLLSASMEKDAQNALAKKSKISFNKTTAILFNRLPEDMQDAIWDKLREWRHKQTIVGHIGTVKALA